MPAATSHITKRVRCYTSRAGYARIDAVLRMQAQLYNAALQERRDAYQGCGETIQLYDQMKSLTGLRQDDPEWAALSVRIPRGTLKRLDRAMEAFFRRVNAGDKPGYPRFKSSRRWNTLELPEIESGMVRPGLIRIKGLPTLNFKGDLPDSKPVSLRLTRRGRTLYASITFEHQPASLPHAGSICGLDVGITDRIVSSNGEKWERADSLDKRKRRLQRSLSRKRKGSRSRRKTGAIYANHCHKAANRRRQAAHRITTDIVRRFDFIAVEDLGIQKMTRAGKGKHGLNREILAQGWGQIVGQLHYKAAWAGRQLVEVNPSYTSQTCSRCGVTDGGQRDGKRYACAACGLRIDADENAAINILRLGLSQAGVGDTTGRTAGCIQPALMPVCAEMPDLRRKGRRTRQRV